MIYTGPVTIRLLCCAFSLLLARTMGQLDPVSFLLIGDWGIPGLNQTMIAAQMGDWALKNKASFVVALGDNFYCEFITEIVACVNHDSPLSQYCYR